MGCFNGTCGISNLPIFAGDKIVLIPLIKTITQPMYNCCYPCDNFTPLGFPIFGEYDDYGGIENAHTSSVNEEFFRALQFFNQEDGKFEKVSFADDIPFDQFISQAICKYDKTFVKIGNDEKENSYSEINFITIHESLYYKMIEDMSNRIPYQQQNNYSHLTLRHFKAIALKEIESLEQYQSISKHAKSEEDALEMLKLSKEMAIRTIAKDIFARGNLVSNKTNHFFAERLLIAPDSNELLNLATDMFMLKMALSAARKGFLCTSGCGSQSEETKMQYIIAEFTINFIRDTSKKRYKQNRSAHSDFCHEETIFFFD